MHMMEEDCLYSVLRDLTAAKITCKDLTGAQELVTGTLFQVFPALLPEAVYPVRTQDINASLPVPAIGVAWEDNLQPRYSFYGQGAGYQHVVRLICIGTVMVPGPNGDLEPDFRKSVNQTLQMRNALRNLYTNDRFIDWFRVSYNDAGTAALFGKLVLRGSPHILDIDGSHFVITLGIEVVDQPSES